MKHDFVSIAYFILILKALEDFYSFISHFEHLI